jgi:hypothetical protein
MGKYSVKQLFGKNKYFPFLLKRSSSTLLICSFPQGKNKKLDYKDIVF